MWLGFRCIWRGVIGGCSTLPFFIRQPAFAQFTTQILSICPNNQDFSWLDYQFFLRILPCTNKRARARVCVCVCKHLNNVHVGFHQFFYTFFAQVLCKETMEDWKLKCCSLPFLTVGTLCKYMLFVSYWFVLQRFPPKKCSQKAIRKAFEKAFD